MPIFDQLKEGSYDKSMIVRRLIFWKKEFCDNISPSYGLVNGCLNCDDFSKTGGTGICYNCMSVLLRDDIRWLIYGNTLEHLIFSSEWSNLEYYLRYYVLKININLKFIVYDLE